MQLGRRSFLEGVVDDLMHVSELGEGAKLVKAVSSQLLREGHLGSSLRSASTARRDSSETEKGAQRPEKIRKESSQ